MSKQWWIYSRAFNYVHANYPCGLGGPHAGSLIALRLEDGTLKARHRKPDSGEVLPISQHEWRRDEVGRLHIEGSELAPEDLEYEPTAVRKLCVPATVGKGGRPTKDWHRFLFEVIRIANQPDGLPAPAELRRHMASWCPENMAEPPEDTAIRDMVRDIYDYVKPR